MPSANDVYITPADRKIDFYQSSAIAASISGSAADDLVLYTNGNSDQLVLDNGGNVGIGTNAPGETLHIVGTGRFTSSVAVGNTTQPTSTGLSVSTTIQVAERSSAPSHIDTWGVLWVKNDDPTNLYFTDDDGNDIALTNNGSPAGGGDIGGTVSAGYIPYASSGDTLANALLFTSGATESMYIGATPGTLNAANYNTTLGYQAGDDMTEGDENTLIGQAAGANITTGDANTMIGRNTGHALTTTSNNTFVGSQAGQNVATSYNTLVGSVAGYNTGGALGSYNNFFGFGAGQNIQGAAQKNVAIGVYALYGNTSNTSATANNVAIGHEAMKEIEGGYSNIGIGTSALLNVTSGYQNIGIGSNAGDSISTAARNVIIGASAVEGSNTDESIIIGAYAGFATTTAIDSSVIIGTYAAQNASPSNAVILGRQAGYYASGAGNVYVGYQSGYGDASTNGGTYNTAVGYEAMEKVQDADENVAIGSQAMQDNTSGEYNTAVGTNALYKNTTANLSTAIGYRAMFVSTTAAQNVSVGGYTLYALTDGDNNVAIGYKSGYDMTTGTENVLVGPESGENLVGGSYNVAIGSDALKTSTAASYSIAIGKNAMSSGDVSAAKHTIGIGYAALQNATSAGESVAVGSYALDAITTSNNNTAIGHAALSTVATGDGNNTAVGREAARDAGATSSYNTAIGSAAMVNGGGNPVGNTTVGYGAGYYLAENYNTYIGYQSGYGTSSTKTHNSNTAVGTQSMFSVTDGDNNVAIGRQAAYSLTTGYGNSLFGYKAGYSLTSGHDNTFIGREAAQNATTSIRDSVIIGFRAINNYTTNSSHGRFTVIGGEAGHNVASTSSDKNNYTAIGFQAGYNDKSDSSHQLFGSSAGYNLSGTSSDGSTFVGQSAGKGKSTGYIAIDTVGMGRGTLGDEAKYTFGDVFIGSRAASNFVSGSYNISIGYDSMRYGGQATIGAHNNIAIGQAAFYNLGRHAASTGSVAIGKGAGYYVSGGSKNIYIGFDAGPSSATAIESNQLYINNTSGTPLIKGDFGTPDVTINGYFTVAGKNGDGTGDRIIRSDSSSLYLQSQDNLHLQAADGVWIEPDDDGTAGGDIRIYNYRGGTNYVNFDGSTQRVGIGTAAPSAKLHVDGDIRIDNGHTLDFDSKGYIDVNVDSGTGDDLFYIRRRGGSNEISFNTTTASAPVIDSPNGTLDFQAASTPVAQFKDDTGIIMQDTVGIRNSVSTISEWMADLAGTTLEGNVVGYGKVQVIKTDTIDPTQLGAATGLKLYLPAAVTGMEYIITYGTAQSNLSGKAFSVDASGSQLIYKGGTEGPVTFSKNTGESLHVSCFETGKWSVVAHT